MARLGLAAIAVSELGGAGVGAHRRERGGLAEPRRHAAAEPRPDRGLLAGGGGVGGDRGARTPRRCGSRRERRGRRRGRRGEGAITWAKGLGRGSGGEPAGVSDARPWLLGGGAGRKPERLAADRHHALGRAGGGDARRRGRAGGLGGRGGGRRRRSARPKAILVSLPPEAAGDRVLARHRERCAGRAGGAGSAISRPPASMATGRAAGWTRRARSRRCTSAGAGGWRRRRHGAPPACRCEVFRLAGIYGPGRSVLDKLREGRAQRVVKPGQVFSRIHVDDIAAGARAPRWRGRRRAPPTTSPTTSRRRREDGDRLRGRAPRAAGAAGGRRSRRRSSRRWRGASGASRSGCRTGGSARSSGSSSPGPTIGPASAAFSRPAAEGPAQQAWRKSATGPFRYWHSAGASAKESAKSG